MIPNRCSVRELVTRKGLLAWLKVAPSSKIDFDLILLFCVRGLLVLGILNVSVTYWLAVASLVSCATVSRIGGLNEEAVF